MEVSNIKYKKKRRNWRVLSGINHDWEEDLRGALEDELPLAFEEERLNLCYKVGGDPPFGEDASRFVGTEVVKTTFDVQEKS